MYTSIGRGRKGPIEQSQKKPKNNSQMNNEGCYYWFRFDENPYKNNSMFLPKDFLEALKRMEPKEVADILLK